MEKKNWRQEEGKRGQGGTIKEDLRVRGWRPAVAGC
jgi:hypothetical protein